MKIDYFEASKFLDEKKEGDIVIRRFHVVKPVLDVKIIMSIYEETYEDDWESCMFSWGMYGDHEGDLSCIDVDKFYERFGEKVKELREDGEEYVDGYRESQERLLDALVEIKGHTLYPKIKKDASEVKHVA